MAIAIHPVAACSHGEADGQSFGATATGLAARAFMALFRPGRSRMDRHVAQLVAQSGGRITDELERRIERLTWAGDEK